MFLAQMSGPMNGAYASLFFFGPLWVAITVWLVVALSFDLYRKLRERQMAAEIVQSMLANPKNSAEDIERVLTAFWGGSKGAAKAAKNARKLAAHEMAAGVHPAKASV